MRAHLRVRALWSTDHARISTGRPVALSFREFREASSQSSRGQPCRVREAASCCAQACGDEDAGEADSSRAPGADGRAATLQLRELLPGHSHNARHKSRRGIPPAKEQVASSRMRRPQKRNRILQIGDPINGRFGLLGQEEEQGIRTTCQTLMFVRRQWLLPIGVRFRGE
jgi:hypothetical protein